MIGGEMDALIDPGAATVLASVCEFLSNKVGQKHISLKIDDLREVIEENIRGNQELMGRQEELPDRLISMMEEHGSVSIGSIVVYAPTNIVIVDGRVEPIEDAIPMDLVPVDVQQLPKYTGRSIFTGVDEAIAEAKLTNRG